MHQNALVIICLVLLNSAFSQSTPNVIKVIADGYSYLGEEETVKAAKKRAMDDAERKAVEQGSGIYLESFSRIHDFMVVDDEIKSISSGYIISKRVILDQLESNPPRYHVQIEAEIKCGDLQKLIAAKEDEKKSRQKKISMEFAIFAERRFMDGSWGEVLVEEGGELLSYDRFQVHFRPSTDCYVYLLLYDSQNKASLLFPKKASEIESFVEGDTGIRSPGANLFYELDNVTGTEMIYLVASTQPMVDVDWLLEKMEKAGGDNQNAQLLEKTIKGRGIGKIIQGRKTSFSLSNGKRMEKVTDVVTGEGTFVRVLSFKHLP